MSKDILVASVDDVRPLASMLRALSFRPKAVMDVHDNGIKITVEEGRSIQAIAYLAPSAFSSFEFTPSELPSPPPSPSSPSSAQDSPAIPHCAFGISLSTMLECLNIFGNATAVAGGLAVVQERDDETPRWKSRRRDGDEDRAPGGDPSNRCVTSMKMSYAGVGEPLVLLLLEESGIVTRCELTTYEPDELMDLPFDEEKQVQRLIIKSEWLRDAFLETDPSSEKLTITFSPAEPPVPTPYNRYGSSRRRSDGNEGDLGSPTFRLNWTGTLGETEMDYPNDKDVLETFECKEPIRNSYKFSHIQLTTRALIASTKTSVRTTEEGLLSFQFMIPLARAQVKYGEMNQGFVEFLCLPLDEEGF